MKKRFEKELQNVKPFTVDLNELRNFSHGKKCTLFAHPAQEKEIKELYGTLLKALSSEEEKDIRPSTPNKLEPHIALGLFKNSTTLSTFKAKITNTKQWSGKMKFQCKEIYLISQEQFGWKYR
eukprot:UN02480